MTDMMTKRLAPLMVLTTLLVGLPILGACLTGQPLSRYFEFPLGGRYVQHAPFSWSAFALFGTLGLFVGAGLILLYFPRRKESYSIAARYPFPWWGWLSAAVLGSFWALAWKRFAWFEPLQSLTFTPLWIAYVVFVNALTYWRTGNCLLTRRTKYLLALFPASALFWWCFEYLNGFAQNWYYVGQELLTPLSYTVLSTAAYSTVLPAVMSTVDLLQSFSRLRHPRFQRPFVLGNRKACAGVVLAFASCGLIGIAAWPDYCYPLLWVSPLFILVSLQVLLSEENLVERLERGHWHVVTLPALAGLLCGFFWEMWNHYSYPKWEYCIPCVQRFKIFEMPVLGYLGYLPFGLECFVIADLVARCLRTPGI
jgi:hypothetical protein